MVADPTLSGIIGTREDFQRAHTQSDVDGSSFAIHHTLGLKKNQAAPGDHNHRADTYWHTAPFKNGWVDYGSTFATAGFRRAPGGVVYVRGVVKNGTLGTGSTGVVFQLPVDCRPKKTLIFATSSNAQFGEIRIDGSGNVYASVGSPTWISLSCSFIAKPVSTDGN